MSALNTAISPMPRDIPNARWTVTYLYRIGISGMLVTIFAMVLALVPPPGTGNWIEYEEKVIGGVAFLILLGMVIYWRARSKGK